MKNKILLKLLEENHIKCTGCGACANSCSKRILSMEMDQEGFYYPDIQDESLCIECGKCVSVCPIDNFQGNKSSKQYGFIEKPETCSVKSSSGGVFYRIAAKFLECGGWVCGSIYDDENKVVTICSNKESDVKKMCGSKYAVSNIEGIYEEIKKHLNNKELVLYCSVPCQIAGLVHFLNREYQNLYLIDLFCYGTPSAKLFMSYLSWKENVSRQGVCKKIKDYEFRDKSYGWEKLVRKITYEDGTEEIEEHLNHDPYFCSFIAKKTLRESCYECTFCREERYGDISIGDFWGVEKLGVLTEEKQSGCGISAILVNTDKGEAFIDILQKEGEIFETTLDDIKRDNLSLVKPPARHHYRDKIYKSMNKAGFEKTAKKYMYLDSGWRHRILKWVPLGVKRYIYDKVNK